MITRLIQEWVAVRRKFLGGSRAVETSHTLLERGSQGQSSNSAERPGAGWQAEKGQSLRNCSQAPAGRTVRITYTGSGTADEVSAWLGMATKSRHELRHHSLIAVANDSP